VRQLLAVGRRVIALARAPRGRTARDRVREGLGGAPDPHRLDVVEADLSQPGCGLGDADWRCLRAGVETVIHCAGDTAFFPEDMAVFRAGHIDGPLELLRRLRDGRLRRWAHLSTAYVCGRRSGTVFEHEGDVGQSFHNSYERVKLESETLMRRAGGRLGVDLRVFRPSVVVGPAPATVGARPSNLFFAFVRVAAALADRANGRQVRLRIAAAPQARFNIVPVEYVAEAIVALAEHPDGQGDTFHLVVSDAPTQQAILAMIIERLGLHGLSLIDTLGNGLENASPLERRVARMLAGYREYLEQDLHFDDATARRLLAGCGVRRPALSADTAHRLIRLALAEASPEPVTPGRWPALTPEGDSGQTPGFTGTGVGLAETLSKTGRIAEAR
jgi:thioester reductase-like protein